MVELHGLVDEGLRREAEALLLPVGVLVYLGPHDLLDQVLRVRAPDALRQRVRTIRHCRADEVLRGKKRERERRGRGTGTLNSKSKNDVNMNR